MQFSPGSSMLFTSPASTGSETAQKTTGMFVSAAAVKAGFAAGVAIAIIISQPPDTMLWAKAAQSDSYELFEPV